jgi:hypothetical protein
LNFLNKFLFEKNFGGSVFGGSVYGGSTLFFVVVRNINFGGSK